MNSYMILFSNLKLNRLENIYHTCWTHSHVQNQEINSFTYIHLIFISIPLKISIWMNNQKSFKNSPLEHINRWSKNTFMWIRTKLVEKRPLEISHKKPMSAQLKRVETFITWSVRNYIFLTQLKRYHTEFFLHTWI